MVSSAATGITSGSSIANVVTTGTFTIPLMKRVGYRPGQAGEVEVSGSVNGQLMQVVEAAPAGASQRIWVEGTNIDGKDICKGVLLPLGDAGPARQRLRKIGMTVVPLGGDMQIAQVQFGSRAEKPGVEQGFKVSAIELPDRPDKEWMFIPALGLLASVVLIQLRQLRRRKHEQRVHIGQKT